MILHASTYSLERKSGGENYMIHGLLSLGVALGKRQELFNCCIRVIGVEGQSVILLREKKPVVPKGLTL